MEKMDRKKKNKPRSPNFSKLEEKVIYSLMRKYKIVFELRMNDSESLKRKNIAWDLLTRDFNRVIASLEVNNDHHLYRDQNALRTKCHNIMKEIRKRARMTAAAAGRTIIGEIDINDALQDHGDFMHEELGEVSLAWLMDEDCEESNEGNEGNEEVLEDVADSGWDEDLTIVKEEVNAAQDESRESGNGEGSHEDSRLMIRPIHAANVSKTNGTFVRGDQHSSHNYSSMPDNLMPNNRLLNFDNAAKKMKVTDDRATYENFDMKNSREDIWRHIHMEEHAAKMEQMRERHGLEMQIRKEEWQLRKQFMMDEHRLKLAKLTKLAEETEHN